MASQPIKTLKLIAVKGIRYPLMGRPSKHITDASAVEVEDHAYYRKALLDGDLLESPTDAPASANASANASAAALNPSSVK